MFSGSCGISGLLKDILKWFINMRNEGVVGVLLAVGNITVQTTDGALARSGTACAAIAAQGLRVLRRGLQMRSHAEQHPSTKR